MSLRRRTILLLISFVCLIVFAVGCDLEPYSKATGGGWIASASEIEGEKATFGFNVRIDPDTEEVTGQFQLVDHGTDQKFHAALNGLVEEGFTGRTDDGLDVFLQVGEIDGEDWLRISVYDGSNQVYFNDAAIQGGTLNFR